MIEFYRNPDTPGIEICNVTQSFHRFPNHSHDNIYAFSLMIDGGSSWNGKNSDDSLVSPGDIAVIPPGLVHSGSPVRDSSSTYRMIYIDCSVIMGSASDILEKAGIKPEFEKIVMGCSKLVPLYKALWDAISRNSSPLELDSALTSFIGLMMTEYGTAGPDSSVIRPSSPAMKRAADFLSSDLDKKILLKTAAEVAGLSKYHFLRSFKQHTGISPHVYRTQKRINAARELIIQGIPFSEIALKTGFTDQSHFTNKFRNYTGASPNQYLAG